jgi:hypothetical protein
MRKHHCRAARGPRAFDPRTAVARACHEACENITAAQLEDLEHSIHELLSRERGHVADLVEALARTLRSGVDKPELEL